VNDDSPPDHAAYSCRIEFKEILRRRRMVRAYEPAPIPRETLERIVGTVRRAPSAGFSQGQRLVVVTEPDGRRAIAAAVAEVIREETALPPELDSDTPSERAEPAADLPRVVLLRDDRAMPTRYDDHTR